jgi:hypothetical protein
MYKIHLRIYNWLDSKGHNNSRITTTIQMTSLLTMVISHPFHLKFRHFITQRSSKPSPFYFLALTSSYHRQRTLEYELDQKTAPSNTLKSSWYFSYWIRQTLEDLQLENWISEEIIPLFGTPLCSSKQRNISAKFICLECQCWRQSKVLGHQRGPKISKNIAWPIGTDGPVDSSSTAMPNFILFY